MKIGNLSRRASIILVVLLLASGVMVAYGCIIIRSILLMNTYSAGTVVASLPANVTINAGLDWGTITQGQNYTLTRVLTNTGAATGPLHLWNIHPLPVHPEHPTPVNQTISVGTLSWDAEGKTIPANGTLSVVFTLQVCPWAELGTFNETISIFD